MKARQLLFLGVILFFGLSDINAQTIRGQRDAGSFPANERNGEFNPFSEGVDSIGIEPSDSTRGDLIAQNTDTINFVKVVRRFDLNLEQYAPILSLDSVHLYQPAMQSHEPSINLGNNGLPILPLTKQFNYQSELDLGFNHYDAYLYHDEDVNYYRAQRPLTRLFYVTGAERENNFEFEHTQNWGRGLNLGVQYERLVSEGFYFNQEIDHRNLAAHVWYQGPKKHFNSMIHYISNRYNNGANGGLDTLNVNGELIQFPDYYGLEDFDQRGNIPVLLPTAEQRLEANRLHWQNSYDFGKNIKVKINDSINDTQIIPRFRVQHRLAISNSRHQFRSDSLETEFFNNTFLEDTLTTRDSLFYRNLSNEIRIKWLGNKLGDSSTLVRQNFLADAYARFSLIDIEQKFGEEDSFTDLVVGGSFRSNPLDSSAIIYKAEGAFHLADYRQGDYFARGEAGFDFNVTGRLVGFLELTNQAQPYTANNFIQSHYFFDNDFDKLNTRVIGGYYQNDAIDFNGRVRFANSSNILFFDENRQPQLSGDAVSYLLVNANKRFQVGKFNLDLSGYYQTTSDEQAIRLPEVIGSGDLYYKGPLFKNKVVGKIGFNGLYTSEYLLNGYDPSLDQFYNQSFLTDYANNPQVGFFSNFQLSRARIFLRLDNMLSLIEDQPILQVATLPQHDFAFRAGINWVFVN